MNRELSTEITINGQPVVLIGRSRISAKSVFGHLDCIQELVIRGARDEWPIGTQVTVSSPQDKLFGIGGVGGRGQNRAARRTSAGINGASVLSCDESMDLADPPF